MSRTDEVIQAVTERLNRCRAEIDRDTCRVVWVEIRLKPGGGHPRSVIVRPEHEWSSTV